MNGQTESTEPPVDSEAIPTQEPAVVVDDLRFTYRGNDEPTLRGLDFEIGTAEIFGFLGPSGAGKSTAQKVLIGLLEGYEERASVLGRDVRDILEREMEWPELAKELDVSRYHRDDEFVS